MRMKQVHLPTFTNHSLSPKRVQFHIQDHFPLPNLNLGSFNSSPSNSQSPRTFARDNPYPSSSTKSKVRFYANERDNNNLTHSHFTIFSYKPPNKSTIIFNNNNDFTLQSNLSMDESGIIEPLVGQGVPTPLCTDPELSNLSPRVSIVPMIHRAVVPTQVQLSPKEELAKTERMYKKRMHERHLYKLKAYDQLMGKVKQRTISKVLKSDRRGRKAIEKMTEDYANIGKKVFKESGREKRRMGRLEKFRDDRYGRFWERFGSCKR